MRKKHYIYLAGNISDDIRTYEWRIRFEEESKNRNLPIEIMNPCNNLFNTRIAPKKKGKNRGSLFDRAVSQKGKGVLPLKDFSMVKICTLIVANLALVYTEKPMIGTVFELAWADSLKIPVIAIVDETHTLGKLYSQHPFIERCISTKVDDEIEAIDIIEDFFIFQ